MEISNLKGPNFCADVKYYNVGLSEKPSKEKERLISIVTKQLKSVPDLDDGFHYAIVRDGCFITRDPDDPPDINDSIKISIKDNSGKDLSKPIQIYNDMFLDSGRRTQKDFGELDVLDIPGSIKKMAKILGNNFRSNLQNIRNTDMANLKELAEKYGYKLVPKK